MKKRQDYQNFNICVKYDNFDANIGLAVMTLSCTVIVHQEPFLQKLNGQH